MAAGIALCAVLYLSNSWERDFWSPGEPDFAVAAREMAGRLRGGELLGWLVPTLGGKASADVSPLIPWCAVLTSLVSGVDPRFAYRLPVAVFSALGLWVTYIAGRRFFDRKVAATACGIQASTWLYFDCGSWLSADALFASACALSVVSLGIVLLWEAGSLRWTVTGWIALGVAALSKSALLALPLVLGTLVVFILLKRGGPGVLRELLGLRPFLGGSIFLALVVPWLIVLASTGGGELVRSHLLGHLAWIPGGAGGGSRRFMGYLLALPLGFLPWSVFLPLVVFYGKAHFSRAGPRFSAVWALWMLLFLGFVPAKEGASLLPMWPALSLLVAAALLTPETGRESIWEEFLGTGVFRILTWALKVPLPVAVAAALFWICGGDPLGLASGILGPSLERDLRKVLSGTEPMAWLALFSLLSAAAYYAAGVGIRRRLREDQPARAVAYLAGATLFAFLCLSFLYEDGNPLRSARDLGREVAKEVGESRLALYGPDRASVRWFLERPIVHIGTLDPRTNGSVDELALDAFLGGPEEVFLIASEGDLGRLLDGFPKYRSRIHPRIEGLCLAWGERAVLAKN